jgi:hypothetical protein
MARERRLVRDEATSTSTPDLASLLNRTKAQAALASLGIEDKSAGYLRSIQTIALEFRSIAESNSNFIAQVYPDTMAASEECRSVFMKYCCIMTFSLPLLFSLMNSEI